MINQLLKIAFFCIAIICTSVAFSQQGTVTGVFSDSDNSPLPGVNIIVKGTRIGTQTDFDGNYSIECKVGDVLVFSYLGMRTREVSVTKKMFSEISNDFQVDHIPVEIIQSDAYSKAIKTSNNTALFIPNFENSERTYNNDNSYFEYHRIKSMVVKPNKVSINYFSPDVHYEVGYTHISSLQYIKKSNLPKLQSTFAQGALQNGVLTFLGPETGNPFSYGPKLSALDFDGSSYVYDTNGQLVISGTGNGTPANKYNNSILTSAFKTNNNLFFNVSTDHMLIGFDVSHTIDHDFFDRELSASNDLKLTYKNHSNSKKRLQWDAFLKYKYLKDLQPTTNGFHTNLLLNSWITPASFDTNQGTVLVDGSQRSFSPNQFNNPNWLLDNNRNSENSNLFVASLQNKMDVNTIQLESHINYTFLNTTEMFGLPAQTNGFKAGYLSQKDIAKNQFNARFNFNYETRTYDYGIKINSVVNYTYDNVSYNFAESTGFDMFSFSSPQNSASVERKLDRNTVGLLNKFSFELNDIDSEISFSNNSFVSSIQENKLFLPTLQLQLNLRDILNIGEIHNFFLNATTSFDVNDMPLFYSNHSHNSLELLPSQSLSYTANNDLFLNPSIKLEEKRNYDIGTSLGFRAFDANFNFSATYFCSKTNGSIFPVANANAFILQNSADIKNQGFELNLDASIYISNDFRISPKLVLASNRTKVIKIYTEKDRLPIAGFSSTSKNLIVGQPAGVIVGSAYQKDAQNNLIIGADGFPLASTEQHIIGDPTPDFTLGFSNELIWKRLKLIVVIDVQKGGDVWNGTQNVLNYFGTSQQSADQRAITNYVFNGVNQQGESNTIPIDFYNPGNDIDANRFVRYGFEGVAEDAIEDCSFINLKSVDVTYSFIDRNNSGFFRQIDVSAYAYNLFTSTKFDGATPYSSLYNGNSGQGLNLFNAPIASEIGLKVSLKI